MSSGIRPHKIVTTLDCPDAKSLAGFYAALLDWRVAVDDGDDHWASLAAPAGDVAAHSVGFELAFQTVPGYCAPEWPNGLVPQQVHLDLYVDSLEDAGALAKTAPLSCISTRRATPSASASTKAGA